MRFTVTKSSRRAFTLVELVTVIAILGVVSLAVVTPTMSYLGTMRTRAAAGRIAADIRYLQRLSLGSGLRTWFVPNISSNNYQLFIEDRNNPGAAGRIALTHPFYQSSSAVALGTGPFTGVSITAAAFKSSTELQFDSFGTPYSGGGLLISSTGTITLTGGIQIKVYPWTGFVERTN